MLSNRKHFWKGLVFALPWLLFCAGLIVYVLSPRLEVSNGTFVLPSEYNVEGKEINPEQLVNKERRMKLAAAILTLSGACGLLVRHRATLFRRSSSVKQTSDPAKAPQLPT